MKTAKDALFLVVSGSYQDLHIGLFRGHALVALKSSCQQRLSACLPGAFTSLLEEAGVALNELDFIAVDQGPGSFSNLRALLATVNGMAYVSGIPLIGLDGLEGVADTCAQLHQGSSMVHAIVLNAYNQELFFKIEIFDEQGRRLNASTSGYASVPDVAARIKSAAGSMPVFGMGNGLSLLLLHPDTLGVRPVSFEPVSYLACLARQAMTAWESGLLKDEVQPLYLKETLFKTVAQQ